MVNPIVNLQFGDSSLQPIKMVMTWGWRHYCTTVEFKACQRKQMTQIMTVIVLYCSMTRCPGPAAFCSTCSGTWQFCSNVQHHHFQWFQGDGCDGKSRCIVVTKHVLWQKTGILQCIDGRWNQIPKIVPNSVPTCLGGSIYIY